MVSFEHKLMSQCVYPLKKIFIAKRYIIFYDTIMMNRAKQKRRSGSAGSHVHVLPAWQPAMARTKGRYVERTLSEDWWHETSDANRSALRRSSRGDGHVSALRTQAGLLWNAGLRVLEEALPRFVRETWFRQWRRIRLDRQDNGTCWLLIPIFTLFTRDQCYAKSFGKNFGECHISALLLFCTRENSDVNVCMLTCLLRKGETMITVAAPIREHESITVILAHYRSYFLSNNVKTKILSFASYLFVIGLM